MSMADQHNNLPLKYQFILELSKVGISKNAIKFQNISFGSDNCIIVKEENQISIVNLKSKKVTPLNVSVDSAIMNPVSNVLGLRAKNNLQIFDLNMKTRIKSIETSESVKYWRWLDARTIAFVTETGVYHWSMKNDNDDPMKQFDIDDNGDEAQNEMQIINYAASNDLQWLFLQGIKKNSMNKGVIDGILRLYSVKHNKYQPTMNAHGACFAHLTLNDKDLTLFCFTKKDDSVNNVTKVYIIEIGSNDSSSNNNNGNTSFKRQSMLPLKNNNDFVVSMVASNKFYCLYAITQQGSLFVIDIQSGKCVMSHSFPNTIFFSSIEHSQSGGIITLDRNGRMCLFHIDSNKYVEYIKQANDSSMAMDIAAVTGLPGMENEFKNQFNLLMQQSRYEEAARLAAQTPTGVLRTVETVKALERSVSQNNGLTPDLQYYQHLLKTTTTLNEWESIDLCSKILNSKAITLTVNVRLQRIEHNIKNDKLTLSEKLGDLVASLDTKLALVIYSNETVNAFDKVVLCMIKLDQVNGIISYVKEVETSQQSKWEPNWARVLAYVQNMQGESVVDFINDLVASNLLTPDECINTLLSNNINDHDKVIEFLLNYLQTRGDRNEDASLQTKLFEVALQYKPQVARSIFESEQFGHFNKEFISQLCEKIGFYDISLQHYQDLNDIRRVLRSGIASNLLKQEFLLSYFGDLTTEDALLCLKDLIEYCSTNGNNNVNVIIEICKQYSPFLTIEKLVELFELYENYYGLYMFLSNVINTCEDSDIVFKYIVSCMKMGETSTLIAVIRESEHYDAKQVKDYLFENVKYGNNKQEDVRPLIFLCDRHGFINELVNYLYNNGKFEFIKRYTTQMSPNMTPLVIGSLLDLNASPNEIYDIINHVKPPQCSIKELVSEVEKRSKLRLLLPWLEARSNEKITDSSLHNALAKIYVTMNNNNSSSSNYGNNSNNMNYTNGKSFLINNEYYDSKIIGQFCETIDPYLSFIAYKRDTTGECDKELIYVTSKYGFFKEQARYCVERQDSNLWELVLNEDNEHRRSLIDQIVNTALPETRNADEIATTVKAFMEADLPNELIELLERIVLSNSNGNNSNDYYYGNDFKNNKNLQNLLMQTAIKADTARLDGYINRLNNYDGPNIAEICISDTYKLYEQGFLIFKKFECNTEAMNVLLNKIGDIGRASEFATYLNKEETWLLLGYSQLMKYNEIDSAIGSFLKARNAKYYKAVIDACTQATSAKISLKTEEKAEVIGNDNDRDGDGDDDKTPFEYKNLILFLELACQSNDINIRKDVKLIHSELIYAYAKIHDLSKLDQFVNNSSELNFQALDKVGDKLYENELYNASIILYTKISNYSKLALAYMKLNEYNKAIDNARQANSIDIWKTLCFACVDVTKFRLASICALNVVIYLDHLNDVIHYYEKSGHFAELIHVLENATNLERANQGIYTHLGVLYCKYKSEKVMEYIKLYWTRVNIPTLINECRNNLHWNELILLYTKYDQFENAINIMMEHATVCFDDEKFKSMMVNINNNNEILYKSITFYSNNYPLLLSSLLIEISSKLDHRRVISMIGNQNHSLIKAYLQYMQKTLSNTGDNSNDVDNKNSDMYAINNALNLLYIEEEDYDSLNESINNYKEFDNIAIAVTLSKHELLQFRRIAALLYRREGRYEQSIDLSKSDQLWEDAIETAAFSNDHKLCEDLLLYFVKNKECPRSCFAAILVKCNKLIDCHIVLSLAWQNNLVDECMPYMIETFHNFNAKMKQYESKIEELEKRVSVNEDKINNNGTNDRLGDQSTLVYQRMIEYNPYSSYNMVNQHQNQNFGYNNNITSNVNNGA